VKTFLKKQDDNDGKSSVESLINNEVFVMDDEAHTSAISIYPESKLKDDKVSSSIRKKLPQSNSYEVWAYIMIMCNLSAWAYLWYLHGRWEEHMDKNEKEAEE
jgi:hypothetical protein